MAKVSKVAQLEARIKELEAVNQELAQKNKQMGIWLTSSLCLIREKFVESLLPNVLSGPFGMKVLEAMAYIEGKVPSTTCRSCSGSGLFAKRDGSFGRCFACTFFRAVTGKGGKQNMIDTRVEEAYKAGQLDGHPVRQFDLSDEVKAYLESKTKNVDSNSVPF